MNKFYVYVYFDPRVQEYCNIGGQDFNYKPIYIGKGQGNRVLKHIKLTKKSKLTNLNKCLIKKVSSPSPYGVLHISKMLRVGGELLGKNHIAILKKRKNKGETSAQKLH